MNPSVCLSVLALSLSLASTLAISPIILVPGDGGSALEMRINGTKPNVRHFFCKRTTRGKWQRLWFAPSVLVPGYVDCWSDNMMLRYQENDSNNNNNNNNKTKNVHYLKAASNRVKRVPSSTVSNAPGVEIRAIPGKKGLTLVEGTDSSNVYRALLDKFGDDIEAKPFDFRLSPVGNPAFVTELRAMVEEIFNKTQEKVTLVAHSLGCMMTHHFLTVTVDQVWKDQYIHAWIPISPALGGAPYDLLQIITGDVRGFNWLSPKSVRDQQRSYESSVWLMPNPHLYRENEILVHTSTANYTAHSYRKLFDAVDFKTGPLIWDRVKDLTPWIDDTKGGYALKDPNVPVFPIYGSNMETVVQFVYHDIKKAPVKIVTTMDGDNTVPTRNLELCNTFSQSSTPLVIDGQGHTEVLSLLRTLEHIETIVDNDVSASS